MDQLGESGVAADPAKLTDLPADQGRMQRGSSPASLETPGEADAERLLPSQPPHAALLPLPPRGLSLCHRARPTLVTNTPLGSCDQPPGLK